MPEQPQQQIVGRTQITTGSVGRSQLNINFSGQAVIRKLLAGNGIVLILSTGIDSGTGDVTIGLDTGTFTREFIQDTIELFSDAEGDPSALGTTAPGVSTFGARRDHVHDTLNDSAVLGSVFNITGAAGTFQDTGLSVTLPNAGRYRISGNARVNLRGNGGAGTTAWWLTVELYNSTDAAVVANSERIVVLTGTTGVTFQTTVPIDIIITVAASKVIKLYAARNGNGTPAWTTTNVESGADGRTVLSYEKIG